MTNFNSIIRYYVRAMPTLVALFLGQKFLFYLFRFEITVTLIILPVMFGYLIMCLRLYFLEKWACIAFACIIILSIFFVWVLTFTMPDSRMNLYDYFVSFLHCVVYISTFVVSISAIYFLIKLIAKNLVSSRNINNA